MTLKMTLRQDGMVPCAMLEDRPIYIFDEWAADQAPQFRFHQEVYDEISVWDV